MLSLRAIRIAVLSVVIALTNSACQPSTATEHMAAAERYRDQGKVDHAIIHAKNSVRLDPLDPYAHELLGDLYLLAKKPQAALRAYEAARAHGAQSPELQIAELKAKLGAGLYREVIEEIRRLDLKSAETDKMLADAYYGRGRYDRARNLYRATDDPERHVSLARLERKSGRYESALHALEDAIAVSPSGSTLLELAQMHRYFSPSRSIDHFLRLANMPGFEIRAIEELVRTYWLMGDEENATQHLAELVKQAPNRESSRLFKALQQYGSGNLKAAASGLLVLYATSQGDYVLLPLALSNFGLQDYASAQFYLRRLLYRDPQNESAAKLLIATMALSGELEFVLPMTERFLDLTHDPELLRMIGEFALRDGRKNMALRAFARARRALDAPEGDHLTLFLDLGAAPSRARLLLPTNVAAPPGAYADNCFGSGISQEAAVTSTCGEDVLNFLLGLSALNASDLDAATDRFAAALKIDPTLTQAELLLAQIRDPRFSATGFRLPTPLAEEPQEFGKKPIGFELSQEQWRAIRSNYSPLAARGNYDALVVEAEFLLWNGDTEAALELLNELTVSHQYRFEAYWVLAQFYMRQSAAQEWLRKVRNRVALPLWDSWEMRMVRAAIFEQANNLKVVSQLARLLQDPVDLYPTFPTEYRLLLAELQQRIDQSLLAQQSLEQVANDRFAAADVRQVARQRMSTLH